MASRTGARNDQLRLRIAQEAARLMLESGVRDYHSAKRKAAERLRVSDQRNLPRNDEIEAALSAHQRLFRGDRQPAELLRRRRLAVDAMRFLSGFRPRLVGSVLSGTADEHSEVSLHLFADAPEEVALFLLDRRIAYEHDEKRVRTGAAEHLQLPVYRFFAEDVAIELVVFHGRVRRTVPLSPTDGRPMSRAALDQVEALVNAESAA